MSCSSTGIPCSTRCRCRDMNGADIAGARPGFVVAGEEQALSQGTAGRDSQKRTPQRVMVATPTILYARAEMRIVGHHPVHRAALPRLQLDSISATHSKKRERPRWQALGFTPPGRHWTYARYAAAPYRVGRLRGPEYLLFAIGMNFFMEIASSALRVCWWARIMKIWARSKPGFADVAHQAAQTSGCRLTNGPYKTRGTAYEALAAVI